MLQSRLLLGVGDPVMMPDSAEFSFFFWMLSGGVVQSKKAAEEAKLVKKQEESEATREAHRQEVRVKEQVYRQRLDAKVTTLSRD